jgi:transposase
VLPGNASLKKFETRVWNLVNRGIETSKLDFSTLKTTGITWFAKELLKISRMKLPDGKATTLAKRIVKHNKDLARFLEEPGVEYHNNRAERQLRPLVIARKNSYGSNTPMGAERNCIIYSVIETCRLNKIRPVDWLKKVLAEPQRVPPSPFLAK